MDAVGIGREEQDALFQLVAGVLYLGNVEFDGSADGEESSVRTTSTPEDKQQPVDALTVAAELLGLAPEALAEALTTRVRQLPGGKTVRSPQTVGQSRDSRDALAKALYSRMFDRLVDRLNVAFAGGAEGSSTSNGKSSSMAALSSSSSSFYSSSPSSSSSSSSCFIGILDIFGFENMAINSFEQLLINHSNERLQLLFNLATFKREEEEYMREEIEWDRTDFPDNQPCVDLIEKKPIGLLPILDSECTRGAAARDAALVSTYNKSFKTHAHYGVCGPSTAWRKQVGSGSSTGSSFTAETDFAILHYAGGIIYSSNEFVDKNRDALFDHVNTLLATGSSDPLVTSLFQASASSSSSSSSSSSFSPLEPPPPPQGRLSIGGSNGEDDSAGGVANLRAGNATVSQRFTGQLNGLIQTLEVCNVRFVRCIKSNQLLAPQVLDKPSVLSQLVCSGVMAALEVRRAGFPTRVRYAEFVKDFRVFAVGFPVPEREQKAHARHARLVAEHRTESQMDAAAKGEAAAVGGSASPSRRRRASLAAAEEDVDSTSDDGSSSSSSGGGVGEGEREGDLERARLLTARMMTHPAVLEAVTAHQYRLGLTKLFLHADTLLVLQSLKHKIMLPKVLRLQRWWVRLSETALAHKLKRAAGLLQELEAQADVGGVHGAGPVRRALEEGAAAVLYARRLDSLNPQVFRPAVQRACQKAQVAEDFIMRALAVKERDAEQRAELLELLDSGRARLGHVQRGLGEVGMEGETRLRVVRLVEKAAEGLSQQSALLLRVANRSAVRGHGFPQEIEEEEESAALRRGHQQAKEDAAAVAGAVVEGGMIGEEDGEDGDPEERARRRRRKVEGVLVWVKDAEAALERLQVQQQRLDEARDKARELLGRVMKELRHVVEVAEGAGIVGGGEGGREGGLIQENLAGAREHVARTEGVVETSQDALALQPAVEHAAFVVSELASLVQKEKKRKAVEDRRREGQGLWDAAHAKLASYKGEAERAGLFQPSAPPSAQAVVEALGAVEAEMAKGALLSSSSDPHAYVQACQALNGRVETVHTTLRAEVLAKQKNDQLREAERARVKVARGEVQALQRKVQTDFALAAEQELYEAVTASLRTLDEVQAAVDTSSAVATLRERVEKVLLQGAAFARLFADVKQRHELQAREVAAAEAKLVAMQKRFQALLVTHGLGFGEKEGRASSSSGSSGSSSSSSSTLGALCEAALGQARDALRALDRAVRQGGADKTAAALSASSLPAALLAVAESLDGLESTVSMQSQRLAAVEKGRQDELARLALAQTRFHTFLDKMLGPSSSSAAASSSSSTATFLDKASVRAIIAQTKSVLQQAEEQLKAPVTPAWLEEEGREGKQQQERRSVNEAISQVEKAKALVEDARQKHDDWQQEWEASSSSFEAARGKMAELEGLVTVGGALAHVRAAQTVLEACQASHDAAAKLVAQCQRTATAGAGSKEGANDENDLEEMEKSVQLLKMRQAVVVFVDKVTHAGAALQACQARKEAEVKEKVRLQERFDAVLSRFQGTVAMVEAAGPTVQMLCRVFSDDAAAAINQATRLLRRGGGGEQQQQGDEGGSMLQPLTAAVLEAVQRVDLLETEAQLIRKRVDRATAFKIAEGKKLASLRETLQVCADKAEAHGLVTDLSKVEAALGGAKENVAGVMFKLEEQPLETWLEHVTVLAEEVDEAVREVAGVEELVDQEAEKQARAAQERAMWLSGRQALQDRHEAAKQAAADGGVVHLATVQAALAAAEVELAAQEGQAELPQRLQILTQRVVGAEEVVATEARRLRAREGHVGKASLALSLLVDRLARLEGALQASFRQTPPGAKTTTTAVKATEDESESEEKKEEKDSSDLSLPVAPAHIQKAVQEAKAAVWEVQRFVREGLTSPHLSLPRTDTAMDKVREAEEALAKVVARVGCLKQQRADALQQYRFWERKFLDLQNDVAIFCAKSSHLRVQMDADWDGDKCSWWGTQSGHTQPGSSSGSSSSSSVAAAAASSSKPLSSVQLIAESIAGAHAALGVAKKRLFAEDILGQDQEESESNDGSTLLVPVDSLSFAAAIESAALKLDRAAEVMEREKVHAAKEEHQRLVALRNLEQQQDRVARLCVMAEARGLDKAVPAVGEALKAAETAVSVVAQLLGTGQALIAGSAFEVAIGKVQEAEEVVVWEIQRKMRYDRQCAAAKEDLVRLKLRQQALCQLVAEVPYLAKATPVADSLKDVERALEHAALTMEEGPSSSSSASSSSLPLATLQAELRTVTRRLEAAEREVRRARIRHEETERFDQQQAEEVRLQVAREAEEERLHGEMEKMKRSQLEGELEKLTCRLALHRPTLDSIHANMARAEEAVKSARDRLSQETGVGLGNGMGNDGALGDSSSRGSYSSTSSSGSSSSKGIAEAAAAAEAALTLTANLEQLLSASAISTSATSSSLSLSPDGRHHTTRSAGTLRLGGGGGGGGGREAALPPSRTTVPVAATFQAYMDKTTHTLEAVARSVEALSLGMKDLQSSVQAQARVIDAQKEILASAASSPDRAMLLGEAGEAFRSSHSFSLSVDVLAPRNRFFSPSFPTASAGRGVDEGNEDEGEEGGKATGGGGGQRLKYEIGRSADGGKQPAAAREEKHRPRDEKRQSMDEEISLLLSKYYSDDLFERLRHLITPGGVGLHDCIAKGSFGADVLELIAGDYDCYSSFSLLFEPVIRACHPRYHPSLKHPTDRNPAHLVEALGPEILAEKDGETVRMARVIASRNLPGHNYTPKMSEVQLREVEATVVAALKNLTGDLAGTYTTIEELKRNPALQEEIELAGLPHVLGMESSNDLSCWPIGRGVLLNKDRSLCIFVNLEDHVTVVASSRYSEARPGVAAIGCHAFDVACRALEALSLGLEFMFDERLGNISISPAKLGTGLALSVIFSSKAPEREMEEVERRYEVVLDRTGQMPLIPGHKPCIIFNKLTLGVTEVETMKEVLLAARCIMRASALASTVAAPAVTAPVVVMQK